ncbi:alpha-glucosidase family protein [Pelagibacterium xiamenense]|uniref:alpha-glucosidase family protein n=1 Tax=Pelagibacterium xiamenense TaxID=2901140 RepID=UPI001E4EE03B|nr:alpha-glucosidase family protein [Pelagibacterium xiamenense]MCD7059174.1 alpha-glucosidase family protein [Pelagibacterium xiamenense]
MNDWWRGCVIYQIYPRSFQDSNADGVGDLRGILSRLEHVAGLGVDAVWLSPVFTSPMADMGYDVSNYTDIDPLFGTLEDFDAVVAKAHELGLKVIIDQVVSHTSDKHPWFVESKASRTNPRADWYVWVEPGKDGMPPNNWPSVFGGPAWEWNATRRQYYLHNFLTGQPDLNFHNREVQDAVLDVMRFWLERGVDGFRFDTVNYYFHDRKLRDNPPAPKDKSRPPADNPYDMQLHRYSKNRPENIKFLKRVRKLMNEFPGTTTVGEVGEAHRAIEIMAAYTAGENLLHMCYSFDMLGPDFAPGHFRSRIEEFFKGAPDGWPCWSFSNHDVMRHVSRWEAHAVTPDAMARLAAAMLLSFRGSVCIYQGEELGLPEAELEYEELTDPPAIRFWPAIKGRDGCRTPMPWSDAANGGFSEGKPWLPVKPPQLSRNVAAEERDPAAPLHFYRAMLAFRRAHPALIEGDMHFYDAKPPILAFARSVGEETLLCVFNLSAKAHTVAFKGLPDGVGLDAISDRAALKGGMLTLEGNGFAFVGLDAGFDPAALSI